MPVTIKVTTNGAEVSKRLQAVFADQMPFSQSEALNKTALSFQKRQNEHQKRIFDIKRPAFVLRANKIKPFSTKKTLMAQVQVEPPGGKRRADVLAKFEEGGTKTPRDGSRIAVPTEQGRRLGTRGVAPRLKAFRFRTPRGADRRSVLVGRERTFLIRQEGGTGLILQRQSRDRVRVLFRFTPEAQIPDSLKFVDNARQTAEDEYVAIWQEEFRKAVRTAK